MSIARTDETKPLFFACSMSLKGVGSASTHDALDRPPNCSRGRMDVILAAFEGESLGSDLLDELSKAVEELDRAIRFLGRRSRVCPVWGGQPH